MAVLKKKLKAATLLESVIAMVIIVISLSIGIMTFSNILHNDRSATIVKATFLLNDLGTKEKNNRTFIDGEERKENVLLKKTFNKYENTESLLEMKLQAYDQDKLILETKEVISLQ
jgi:hypothetical protein